MEHICDRPFHGLILLTLLVTLTGKDKAKWLIILIPLMGMVMLITKVCLFNIIPDILTWVIFAISTYFALACASERLNLPGRKLLTADGETDFKASGSVLGYILFAAISETEYCPLRRYCAAARMRIMVR